MKASPLPNDQRPGCGHSLLNFLTAQKRRGRSLSSFYDTHNSLGSQLNFAIRHSFQGSPTAQNVTSQLSEGTGELLFYHGTYWSFTATLSEEQ